MNIKSAGICRASQKIYEKLIISDFEPDLTIAPYMSQEEGVSPLPCKLYHLQGNEYVSAYPDLPIESARYAIGAFDAEGKRIDSATHELNFKKAKWESRKNYRLKPELCKEIRLYDETHDEAYAWGTINPTLFIGCPDHIQCRMQFDLYKTNSKTLRVSIINNKLGTIADSFTLLGEASQELAEFSKDRGTVVSASFFIPWDVADTWIVAWSTENPNIYTQLFFSAENWKTGVAETDKSIYNSASVDPYYPEWFEIHRAKPVDLMRQAKITFEAMPLFSIIVPLYKTPVDLFDEMLGSVLNQSYKNWECVLVNSTPECAALTKRVDQAARTEPRIKVVTLEKNLGISLNTNAGIAEASGDFICFFDHDDLLEPNILFEYAKAINKRPDTDLLYCDEDKLNTDGVLCDAVFKPDFNLDFLRDNNYICHMLCIRRTLLNELKPNTPEFDGAQDHNLTLEAIEKARHVEHVPRVLYHWRKTPGSTAESEDAKPYAAEAGVRAVQSHLDRIGVKAKVHRKISFTYQVDYEVPDHNPLISIIIPSRDHADLLKTCIDSILSKSTYQNFEIVVVENNSEKTETFNYYDELSNNPKIKIVSWKGIGFNFSELINFGRAHSAGEYLILLNNDTEIITPNWIEKMLGNCARKEVGVVGVKLLYPDMHVQHAGLVIAESPVTFYLNLPATGPTYAQRNVSAVTAACCMVDAKTFDEAKGFDPDFAVAYNDVDFCLKVRDLGKLIVFLPDVELFHYESVSRGYDDNSNPDVKERFTKELNLLRHRWAKIFTNSDPYYSKNLSQDSWKAQYFRF
jgi:O-antigen biosynthesis protein